jgi:hypothetical protein
MFVILVNCLQNLILKCVITSWGKSLMLVEDMHGFCGQELILSSTSSGSVEDGKNSPQQSPMLSILSKRIAYERNGFWNLDKLVLHQKSEQGKLTKTKSFHPKVLQKHLPPILHQTSAVFSVSLRYSSLLTQNFTKLERQNSR